MKALRQPTITKVVCEYLRNRDDFSTYVEMRDELKYNHNQITAACFNLKKYKVADMVVDHNGKVFWYALPMENEASPPVISVLPV